MRVGLFTLRMVDNPTGMANYARCLSYALRRVNPDMEIVLVNPHPHARKLEWFQDFATYRFQGIAPSGSRISTVTRLVAGLAAATQRVGLDIIHAPGNVAPFIGPRLGAKRIVTVHDVAPLVLPMEHSLRLRLVHATMIPPLRWTADAVLTDSFASKRDIVTHARLDPNKIYVTPLGTTCPTDGAIAGWKRRTPELGIGGPFFLAVGDITPRKNLLRVVSAFRNLLSCKPDVRLVIAGRWVHEDRELMHAIHELDDSAVEVGYVDDDKLNLLYAGAAALVFPSLYEGFGLPVLEAMARGTPVITSNISSLPEVAGDAALIIDPHRTDAIAAAMLRVLTDDTLVRTLGRRGRQRALHYTWEQTARQTIDVYERVMRHADTASACYRVNASGRSAHTRPAA